MTYKEALDILSTESCALRICTGGGVLCCNFTDCNIKASFNKALEALEKVEQLEKENKELKEKQTPKKWKPAITEIVMTSGKKLKLPDHICPVCGYSLSVDAPYCECCGQAIDWSE